MGTIFEQITLLREEASQLEFLLKKFPDTRTYKDRWGRVYYYSPSVNAIADKFGVHNGCGCCSDSGIMFNAWTELKWRDKSIQIYTSPAEYCIGENTYGGEKLIKQKAIDSLASQGLNPKGLAWLNDYKRACDAANLELQEEEEEDFDDEEIEEELPSPPVLKKPESIKKDIRPRDPNTGAIL